MSRPDRYTIDESVARGEEWYQRGIRAQVETDANKGKIVVIDVETGEYEMDADALAAARRHRASKPDATLYALRVGYPALAKIGGGWNTTLAQRRQPQ